MNVRRTIAAAPVRLFVALLLLGNAIASAQTQTDTISLERRVLIATRIYTAGQTYFAHWDADASFDIDREYASYVGAITRPIDRREFDLASMAFVAKFANGHTWFGDWWLRRRDGQRLGFYAHPIAGQWVVTESTLPNLPVGAVIERVDSTPIATFYSANRKYLFGSDERWRERTLFEHPYLFPSRFDLGLAGGHTVRVERSQPFMFHGDDAISDSVTLTRDSVLVIRIPSFAKPQFEDSALAALRKQPSPRALVLDLRGNHGGAVPNRLVRALMDRPYHNWLQSTPSSVALFRSWGVLGWHSALAWTTDAMTVGKPAYSGPVFVIVDGGCYSACEDAVMPFLDNHRATIVGERTAGSSTQTTTIDLGDGMAIGIAAVQFRLPDGRRFEGFGLEPDVLVPTRIEDLRAAADPALGAILRILRPK